MCGKGNLWHQRVNFFLWHPTKNVWKRHPLTVWGWKLAQLRQKGEDHMQKLHPTWKVDGLIQKGSVLDCIGLCASLAPQYFLGVVATTSGPWCNIQVYHWYLQWSTGRPWKWGNFHQIWMPSKWMVNWLDLDAGLQLSFHHILLCFVHTHMCNIHTYTSSHRNTSVNFLSFYIQPSLCTYEICNFPSETASACHSFEWTPVNFLSKWWSTAYHQPHKIWRNSRHKRSSTRVSMTSMRVFNLRQILY